MPRPAAPHPRTSLPGAPLRVAGVGLALTVLALIASLLAVRPDVVAAQPADGAPADCAPLPDGQLVAQLIGTPVRQQSVGAPLGTAMAEQAGTAVLFSAAVASADQVRDLTAALDDAAPTGVPPLVAVDEEGGRVSRLGRAGLVPRLPSARQMAATGDPAATRAAAADLARAMADLGVDLDLAPVLDLSDAPADSIIGDRSFSPDAVVAGQHAAAFAAGLHDGGVATTAKHFPDHGLTETDTHTDAAVVDVTRDQLAGPHLQPYRIALPDLDAIMLSHLTIPALDPDRPVSLSAAAVAFLRDQLAVDGRPWDGVVVTDDLSMQAVAAVASQPDAALAAVAAGVDLVLVGDLADLPAVHDRLRGALASGALPRSRARTAARRVLQLKGLADPQIGCLLGTEHFRRAG